MLYEHDSSLTDDAVSSEQREHGQRPLLLPLPKGPRITSISASHRDIRRGQGSALLIIHIYYYGGQQ